MAGLNYITLDTHYKEVDSLLNTIEKLGMLASKRKKEIELLNARIALLESQLEELQEEQK